MKKNLLIIENDQDIRHIVQFILQEEGYHTMSIPEPDNLNSIVSFQPDLILLDEFINNQPGHRLCRKIKQIPALATVPVIILSTAADVELIATECEANDFIRKPFDIADLTGKVSSLLDHFPLTDKSKLKQA